MDGLSSLASPAEADKPLPTLPYDVFLRLCNDSMTNREKLTNITALDSNVLNHVTSSELANIDSDNSHKIMADSDNSQNIMKVSQARQGKYLSGKSYIFTCSVKSRLKCTSVGRLN